MYPGLASIVGTYIYLTFFLFLIMRRFDRLKILEEKIDNNIRRWKELKKSDDRRS